MKQALFQKLPGGHLAPADAAAEEFTLDLPIGKYCWATMKRARNPRRHRLFWALVKIVKDNTGLPQSSDAIAAYLKIKGGHVEVFRKGDKITEVPASIAFSKCTETEFAAFLDRLMDVIRQDFIPHLEAGDLRAELERITGLTVEQTQ